jgi:hypothetical protein
VILRLKQPRIHHPGWQPRFYNDFIALATRRENMGDAGSNVVSITKIADAVTYQQGSIVSREIVSRPTGTVTLLPLIQARA